MNKVIIITGASSGFGKSIAERLSQHGHTVYGICRRQMEHHAIKYMQGDIRDTNRIAQIIKDILELTSWDEIKLQMETNFYGCVNVCQKVLPYMRRQHYGKIINFSSIAGIEGIPYQGFYSCSKFAIEGFSEALSAEVKRFGISISIVEPGDFATGFTAVRTNSEETLKDPDYGPIFSQVRERFEKEEINGLRPEYMAKKVEQIVNAKHPHLRYCVANLEQKLSVILKRFIPGNWNVDILRSYYKS